MLEDLQNIAFESSKSSHFQNERMVEPFICLRVRLSLISKDEREIFMRFHEMLSRMCSKTSRTLTKRRKKSSNIDRNDLKRKSIGQITQTLKLRFVKALPQLPLRKMKETFTWVQTLEKRR